MAIHSEKLTFEGAGGEALAARLDRPDGQPRAYALIAHCFTCSKDLVALARTSAHLAAHGIAALRFDFTGLGHSGGEFENTDFSSNVADLVAAAEYMERELQAPRILIGHSFGGTAVIQAAGRIASARAVCTVAAPFDPTHVEGLFSEKLDEIEEEGSAQVTLGERSFRVRREFLEDIRSASMKEALGDLGRALLVMHSPRDEVVGIDNARLIYEAAKHPKSFIGLDEADHLLTDPEDAEFVARVLTAWSARYLPGDAESTGREGASLDEPDTLVASESDDGKYVTHLTVGPHHFVADQPPEAGGKGAGPDPYDLVAASLGACTSMTIRMYADRKEWPLEHVEVRVDHERRHAKDCERCEEQQGKIDHLTRTIHLRGDLSDEQRERLTEIADRCPVHRTLTQKNVIETRLAD